MNWQVINQAGLVDYLTSVGSGLTVEAVKALIQLAVDRSPSLQKELDTGSPEIASSTCKRLAAELRIMAGKGNVSIDKALIDALEVIELDHQDGKVVLSASNLQANRIRIGGKGSGQSSIGEHTKAEAAGSSIQIGSGGRITITGDAHIDIT